MLYHCFASFKHTHRRRSDWNSGGRMEGLTIKVLLWRQNTFSYIVMQVIWCLKFCNMTISGGTTPLSESWGTCPQRRRQENSSGGPSFSLGGRHCPSLPILSLPSLPSPFPFPTFPSPSLHLSSLPLPLEVSPLKSS